MGLFSKFNNGSVFGDIDTTGMQYASRDDVYSEYKDKVFKVRGLFINPKSKYGDSAVAILEEMLLNLPSSQVDNVKEILSNSTMVEAIRAGKLGLKIEPYQDKKHPTENGEILTRYGIDWVDL